DCRNEGNDQKEPALAMLAAPDITTPAALIGTEFTFHLGEIHLGPLDASIVVLALGAAMVSALNLWRIGTEDREKRLLGALRRHRHHGRATARIPRTPWYQQLGAKI